MDIYCLSREFLLAVPLIQEWPEMQQLVEQAVARQDRNWQLPLLACEAVGGKASQAIPAVAAIACLQISIILIDDMLDADPRGAHQRLGAPATSNLAAAFQAAGLESITGCEASTRAKLAVMDCLTQMALTTSLGQQLDVQNPADEAAYWQVVKTKSAPFFAAALQAGALLGGAAAETARQIKQFGGLYGEMIQIYDDLHDTLATPANPDWTQGRSPLPILFAQRVEHPERAKFVELRKSIAEPEALAEAQQILIREGAVSYSVYQLLGRHEKAKGLLAAIPLQRRAGLETLLAELMEPVEALLQSVAR